MKAKIIQWDNYDHVIESQDQEDYGHDDEDDADHDDDDGATKTFFHHCTTS